MYGNYQKNINRACLSGTNLVAVLVRTRFATHSRIQEIQQFKFVSMPRAQYRVASESLRQGYFGVSRGSFMLHWLRNASKHYPDPPM